jgi:orotidine-5'-phosphate decarboxylase
MGPLAEEGPLILKAIIDYKRADIPKSVLKSKFSLIFRMKKLISN